MQTQKDVDGKYVRLFPSSRRTHLSLFCAMQSTLCSLIIPQEIKNMSNINVSKYIQEYKDRVAKHPRADFTYNDIQGLVKFLGLDKLQLGQEIDLWKVITTSMMFGYVRGVRSENRRLRKVHNKHRECNRYEKRDD